MSPTGWSGSSTALRAIDGAEAACVDVLRKADFWQRYAREPFNKRQKTVLNRFLDGFEGKLTAKKRAAIGKCSIPTAQCDINEQVERSILRRNPGGSKNTYHDLVMAACACSRHLPCRPAVAACGEAFPSRSHRRQPAQSHWWLAIDLYCKYIPSLLRYPDQTG